MTTDATRFGLRRRPFPSTPDASCYYPATSHEKALARLQTGLAEGEGVLLLTGEPGTGKTLLCHCLLERLGPSLPSAFVTNSHLANRTALLQALLFDLALPYQGRSEQEMRLALTEHLLQTFAAGGPTLLIVDEAHHLAPELLEELRLLGNLEGRRGKALQVVLIAQPSILETLQKPGLLSFRQRLAATAVLAPLGVHEAADFVVHQLRLAGGRPEELISEEALGILARGSGGVPRLLCRAAHQALRLAHAAGAATVDAEAALEALNLLGLSDQDPAEGEGQSPPPEAAPSPPVSETPEPERAAEESVPRDTSRLRRLFAEPRRTA
jgi:type II secretory pathway predicted ATPase ExeA